jgi:hypothetical protein
LTRVLLAVAVAVAVAGWGSHESVTFAGLNGGWAFALLTTSTTAFFPRVYKRRSYIYESTDMKKVLFEVQADAKQKRSENVRQAKLTKQAKFHLVGGTFHAGP